METETEPESERELGPEPDVDDGIVCDGVVFDFIDCGCCVSDEDDDGDELCGIYKCLPLGRICIGVISDDCVLSGGV